MNAASSRPAPRKSSLLGSTPVAPPVPAPAPAPEETPAPAPVHTPPAGSPPRAGEEQTTPSLERKRKYPPKVSFYQDLEDTRRVRAAVKATREDRNMSGFIHDVVMAEVERLEQLHNGGRPFPGGEPGELPTGRPLT
jgi:hypothetical protein